MLIAQSITCIVLLFACIYGWTLAWVWWCEAKAADDNETHWRDAYGHEVAMACRHREESLLWKQRYESLRDGIEAALDEDEATPVDRG